MNHRQADDMNPKAPMMTALALVLLIVLVVGAIVASYFVLFRWVILVPEFALPLLVLAGAALFIGALALLSGMFKNLGLSDKSKALALPDGSVRALLALIIVFLFFVAALFLFGTVNKPSDRELRVSGARYEQIPIDQIVKATPVPNTSPVDYDVTLQGLPNQAGTDIAKTLITLLGTLVTAIAAFYFGAGTTMAATQAERNRQKNGKKKDGDKESLTED